MKVITCLPAILMIAFTISSCEKEDTEEPDGQRTVPTEKVNTGVQEPKGNTKIQVSQVDAHVKTGTVTLTNANWSWPGARELPNGGGGALTRYADINTPLITAGIMQSGTVLVFFRSSDENLWVPLPYTFVEGDHLFSHNFVYEYTQEKIRLHFFYTDNDANDNISIPSAQTAKIGNYTFKYLIIGGSFTASMKQDSLNTDNLDTVLKYLNY